MSQGLWLVFLLAVAALALAVALALVVIIGHPTDPTHLLAWGLISLAACVVLGRRWP